MKSVDLMRAKFRSAQEMMAKTSGVSTCYWLGVSIGIVDVVAAVEGIQWIEADVLLRKES